MRTTKKAAPKKTATTKAATKKAAKRVDAASQAMPAPVTEAATAGVSQETIDRTVRRASVMLHVVGRRKAIRVALATVGYSDDEHRHGWKRVYDRWNAGFGLLPDTDPRTLEVDTLDRARRVALEAVRVWFEKWSELARVVIKHRDTLIRMGLVERAATPQT